MNRVFADAFYFFAILNPDDAAHERARAYASQHHDPIVTTAWVLTELADGLAATQKRHVFAQLVARLQADPDTDIVPPGEELIGASDSPFYNNAYPRSLWPRRRSVSHKLYTAPSAGDSAASANAHKSSVVGSRGADMPLRRSRVGPPVL